MKAPTAFPSACAKAPAQLRAKAEGHEDHDATKKLLGSFVIVVSSCSSCMPSGCSALSTH
jgi:hypothetical protein